MTEESTTLYCYVHPDRETSLRCNKCERPICAQCAVRTPTGYRCKECVRGQQKIFNTAEWYDYIIGFSLTAILSLIVSVLIFIISGFIGFFMFFISFAIAGAAGVFIANITQRALRKRRSRQLFMVVAAGVVVGAIPVVLFLLFSGSFFSIIWQAIYLITATPTVYGRLSGFTFSR